MRRGSRDSSGLPRRRHQVLADDPLGVGGVGGTVGAVRRFGTAHRTFGAIFGDFPFARRRRFQSFLSIEVY